ncbi:MAG: HEPN domain-containing protein [Rhodospirillales bacterium]
MRGLPKLFDSLETEIKTLRKEYLETHLSNPASGPDEWSYAVKSFCILSHAAFEDFAEDLSIYVCDDSLAKWDQQPRQINIVLLSLTAFYQEKLSIENNEQDKQDKVIDQLRITIEKIKILHRKAIDDNNGFSKKYLRTILTPVAINIPEDPISDGALQKFSTARGSYAHTRAKDGQFTVGKSKWDHNKKLMSPDDASDLADDCLEICRELITRAKTAIQ